MFLVTGRRPRLHFVWMGPLPYYCRLAIQSAVAAMPDASITLHLYGSSPRSVHLDLVRDLPGVTVAEVDLATVFDDCPGGSAPYLQLIRRLPGPAAVSNLLRLAIVHRHGGVYLDTDVLVVRPIHDPSDHGAFVGREWVWDQNRRRVAGEARLTDQVEALGWLCDWGLRRLDTKLARGRLGRAGRDPQPSWSRLQVNNAVIGAPPRSDFVALALEASLAVDPTVRFALGPSLLDDVARTAPRTVLLLPPSRFYAVPPAHSFRWFEDETLELPIDAQVMHVVASNHRRLLTRLDERDPRFHGSAAPYWRVARGVRSSVRRRTAERPTVPVGSR